jgi:2-succinyl-6-hydroxy-2,4-cyclohexadiene-1-carboxylate synthase
VLAAELLHPSVPSGEPPLALVHGFTQTGRSWGAMATRLAQSRPVLLVDAPGHGASADLRLDLWGAGRALLETVGEADLLGYSMGGRICLHAALLDPASRRRLVLVGATAGIVDGRARRRRRAEDAMLARTIEEGGDAGLPEFLDLWLAGPLFAGLSPEAAGRAARLENHAAGLASSLRLCGTGTQEVLDERLGELTMPVLVVVGERDAKFRAEADRLAAGLGCGEIATIEGAGHACHLERPVTFLDVVEDWLVKTAPARG